MGCCDTRMDKVHKGFKESKNPDMTEAQLIYRKNSDFMLPELKIYYKKHQKGKDIAHISLVDRVLTLENCEFLAFLITELLNIESLVLQNNSIGPEGIKSIAKSLETAKNLKKLRITHNKLQNNGLDSLVSSVSVLTEIEEIDLRFNDFDSSKVFKKLASLSKLRVLSLQGNPINKSNVFEIQNSFKSSLETIIEFSALSDEETKELEKNTLE